MKYDLDAFDQESFESVRTLMKDRLPEMIEGYLEDARLYVHKITEGFSANDKKTIADYAHPLKSSSASLGLLSVSKIAEDIEHAAKKAIEENTEIIHLAVLMDIMDEAFKHAEKRLEAAVKTES